MSIRYRTLVFVNFLYNLRLRSLLTNTQHQTGPPRHTLLAAPLLYHLRGFFLLGLPSAFPTSTLTDTPTLAASFCKLKIGILRPVFRTNNLQCFMRITIHFFNAIPVSFFTVLSTLLFHHDSAVGIRMPDVQNAKTTRRALGKEVGLWVQPSSRSLALDLRMDLRRVWLARETRHWHGLLRPYSTIYAAPHL